MSITVTTLSDHDIQVSVEDDGNGPGGGPPGIGSAIIEQATNGRWKLESTPHGSLLTAIVTASSAATNFPSTAAVNQESGPATTKSP